MRISILFLLFATPALATQTLPVQRNGLQVNCLAIGQPGQKQNQTLNLAQGGTVDNEGAEFPGAVSELFQTPGATGPDRYYVVDATLQSAPKQNDQVLRLTLKLTPSAEEGVLVTITRRELYKDGWAQKCKFTHGISLCSSDAVTLRNCRASGQAVEFDQWHYISF